MPMPRTKKTVVADLRPEDWHCRLCGETTDDEQQMQQHLRIHHHVVVLDAESGGHYPDGDYPEEAVVLCVVFFQ